MSDALNVSFDQYDNAKQVVSITTAGIHRGFRLKETTWTDPTTKDGKVVPVDIHFIFEDDEKTIFNHKFFPAPENASEIKFRGGVYKDNVKLRDQNDTEAIQAQFGDAFYFYQQLATALGIEPARIQAWKQSLGGSPEGLNKRMFTAFNELIKGTEYNKVDIKVLWNNNDNKKTSFLGLARVNGSNLAFGKHYAGTEATDLVITAYEQKNSMVQKYLPQAPASNNTVVNNLPAAGTGSLAGNAAIPLPNNGGGPLF